MEPENAIYSHLTGNSQLTDLVGNNIYPVTAPQNATGAVVVIDQLDEDEQLTQDGPISNGWLFKMTTVAPTNQAARNIAREVKKALNWQTISDTYRATFLTEETAGWDKETKEFLVVHEYRLRHK